MSHTNEGDQRRAESSNRVRAEPQVGPSGSQPIRQGYCGYCRVLYTNLDQHLASLRHLDSVHISCQGSDPPSTLTTGRTRQTLMERFLHDVLQHHPHHYQDNRPSHADLPCISTPPLPGKELDEVFLSDVNQPLGAREHTSRNDPDIYHQPVNPVGGPQSVTAERIHDRLSGPSHAQLKRYVCTQSGPNVDTGPPSQLRPWCSWHKERREAQKEVFSLDQCKLLDQTIEEVIQKCCHGVSSTSCDEEKFFFSLPVSMDTQSDDSDSVVQVALQTPVQVRQIEDQHVSRLMEVQVDLEDQMYAQQLDAALQSQQRARDGARLEDGFWALPIEEVLPAPEHIPESFRGKTWAQIEQEDEEKVEKLVRQFRKEKFICYFDSESLARFGRRSHKKEKSYDMVVVSDGGVLPLLDCGHDGSECARKTKRRVFKLASRCQVVKVSHSTQTIQLVAPAVRQPGLEAPSTGISAPHQDTEERTPNIRSRQCLPRSYSKVMTPLQPGTSLVYLLCSPSTSSSTTAISPLPKRCRKKKRPPSLPGLKVTYKHFPLQFYEPSRHRILKKPPKGYLPHQGSTSSSLPPSCVRQLFRSLSPDLNADSHSFPPNKLSRDAAHADAARGQNRGSQSRSERGRSSRKVKTCLPASTRRLRSEALPTQGLRRSQRASSSVRSRKRRQR
ncbi:Zinc finger-containing protein 2 [Takifugu flavidus]|uniref:Zinc finger-containing protein 2 n=1 Tax=Takifugu flavidus TaxID=433684 RepID=A0A5C6NAC3_9TELE|nr:Zinc finger-containing protein 2 [Takifugu flavidus]